MPANSARATGSCSADGAPKVPVDVTQYTNSQVCQNLGGIQYWAMSLKIGDKLTVSGLPIPSSGGAPYMNLDIYGPNVQTIGQSLCSSDANGSSFSETCVIPATGTYLLVSDEGSGQFTPRVNHPLLTALRHAYTHWSPSGRSSVVQVQASSPAAATVCLLVAPGWKKPSQHLSCDHPHLTILAKGQHVFTRKGSAHVALRFAASARRLLAARRSHKLTLITIYSQRGRGSAVADEHVSFRPR